ncbi:hypothetical protein ABBQ38_014793 [Trebouxia sp. C0009 RCD-2024]
MAVLCCQAKVDVKWSTRRRATSFGGAPTDRASVDRYSRRFDWSSSVINFQQHTFAVLRRFLVVAGWALKARKSCWCAGMAQLVPFKPGPVFQHYWDGLHPMAEMSSLPPIKTARLVSLDGSLPQNSAAKLGAKLLRCAECSSCRDSVGILSGFPGFVAVLMHSPLALWATD